MLDLLMFSFLPVAIISLGAYNVLEGIRSVIRSRKLAQVAVSSSGSVTNVRRPRSRGIFPELTVQFRTQDGEEVAFTETDYSLKGYRRGDSVPVSYNPQSPWEAAVGHPESLAGWARTATPVAGGVAVIGFGLFILVSLWDVYALVG